MKSTGMVEGWGNRNPSRPPPSTRSGRVALEKGGDRAKRGNKNEGRLMLCHFRKEAGIGKAGENWGT